MKMMNDYVTNGTLLVAGGIIGAGLALLVAPQSGQRTRRDIVRISRRVKEQTADAVEEFSETVHEMVEAVVDKATELVDKGHGMAQGAKKELLKVIDEGQTRLEQEKNRLTELLN
jgi:gas vesicle protein